MRISNIISYLPKSPLVAIGGLFAAVTLSVGAFAAFGPDRPTLTWNGDDTPGADYVTFNSFVNHPSWGDERNFLRGAVSQRDSGWNDPLQKVGDGDIVEVIAYIHNNADTSLNASGEGIARNTTFAIDVPVGPAQTHDITATISASNANPTSVYDSLTVNSDGYFELEYIPGSAHISGNHIDAPLSDAIFTGGALLGNALDGNMEGCFDDSVFVRFDVKVKQPNWEINKTVRHAGTGPGNWNENIKVNTGDQVEWLIQFDNIGTTILESVNILDEIPAGLSYVPGSGTLINGNFPDGKTLDDASIQANNTQINSIIGSYLPDATGYILFATTVDAEACGMITNQAFAQPAGYGAVVDGATVDTGIPCEDKFEFACSALAIQTLNADTRTVRAHAQTTMSSNVVLKEVSVDFGDGAVVVANPADHTYASEGTYNVVATVTFELQDEAKTVETVTCAASVKFVSDVERCEVPGKEHLPKDDPNCKTDPVPEKPTTLPNTGAGTAIVSFFGATSAAAAAYGYIQNRRMA